MTLESTSNNVQNFLNSSIVIYADNNISFEDIFNPNYFNLLYNLIMDSSSIAIYSTEYEVFDEIFKKVFGAKQISDNIYTLESKRFLIEKDEKGIFLNMVPVNVEMNPDFTITGSTINLMGQHNLWDFFIVSEARTLIATFESKEYRKNYKTFSVASLEDKKIFGESLKIELLRKDDFTQYFTNFFLPVDEESEYFIDYLKQIIVYEEFVGVSSTGITNNEIALFFQSPLDQSKLSTYIIQRNLPQGKIGTYNYYLFTQERSGEQLYLYTQNEEFIISNIEPNNMNVYLSEKPRFKNSIYYKNIDNKDEILSLTVLDLSNYIYQNFYGSLESWIIIEEYLQNDVYKIKMKIR